MTPGFKPFTVKIHSNPFPQEHPFNTQVYVVLWNGDVPGSELMQQNNRQDGKDFCVKNMTGLLLPHFVVLVFYKKICEKEGKDWQKLISNIYCLAFTFKFAVFVHLSSFWVSSLVSQRGGFTLSLHTKPKYNLGQRTMLITDYNDIHNGWKPSSGNTIKCSATHNCKKKYS